MGRALLLVPLALASGLAACDAGRCEDISCRSRPVTQVSQRQDATPSDLGFDDGAPLHEDATAPRDAASGLDAGAPPDAGGPSRDAEELPPDFGPRDAEVPTFPDATPPHDAGFVFPDAAPPPDAGFVFPDAITFPDASPPPADAGARWYTEVVSTSGGSSSSIMIEPSTGSPVIAYFSDSPRGIHYRRFNGPSWSGVLVVDGSVNAIDPAILFSMSPVVAYGLTSATSAAIGSARIGGSPFPAPPLGGPDRPDLALAGSTEWVVGVQRVSGGQGAIRYARRPAGAPSWSALETLASNPDWFGPKIAGNAAGDVFILYGLGTELWMSSRAQGATGWTSVRIAPGAVYDFDIAADDSGTAHLVRYEGSTGIIYYEAWSATARQLQTLVERPGGTPPGSMAYSGLAVAYDGRVHISYLDFTRGGVLRYVVSDAFVPETVADCDDVLGDTSIAVDRAGRPHISYPAPAPSFSSLGYAVKR